MFTEELNAQQWALIAGQQSAKAIVVHVSVAEGPNNFRMVLVLEESLDRPCRTVQAVPAHGRG